MLALDVVRLEAGLILLEVDYTSARHAMNAEQAYSPAEIGLGRLVDLDKGPYVGQRALAAEARAGGPARRLVGLELDWADIDALYAAQDLPPIAPAAVSRAPVPVFDRAGRQVGRATSTGWSPILKKPIALASVPPAHERTGSRLAVRVDRRGSPRPGGRDGRRAAVPRPAAQARLSASRLQPTGQAWTSASAPTRLRKAASSMPVPVNVHDGDSPGSTYTT